MLFTANKIMIVKQILTNPIYLGNLVQLKTYTLSYKNRKQVKNEPEDMVTIYNTHEAIVTQELWDKCREMEASVSQGKKNKTGYVNPLSGLVYCADCGNKMYIAWNNTRHKRTDPRTYHRENFKCGAYSKFGDRVCSSHYNPSNPAPHSQRKATRASPLHRQIYSCGHRLWSDMWSNAKKRACSNLNSGRNKPILFTAKTQAFTSFCGKTKEKRESDDSRFSGLSDWT